jgi:hypothetical protein
MARKPQEPPPLSKDAQAFAERFGGERLPETPR